MCNYKIIQKWVLRFSHSILRLRDLPKLNFECILLEECQIEDFFSHSFYVKDRMGDRDCPLYTLSRILKHSYNHKTFNFSIALIICARFENDNTYENNILSDADYSNMSG